MLTADGGTFPETAGSWWPPSERCNMSQPTHSTYLAVVGAGVGSNIFDLYNFDNDYLSDPIIYFFCGE